MSRRTPCRIGSDGGTSRPWHASGCGRRRTGFVPRPNLPHEPVERRSLSRAHVGRRDHPQRAPRRRSRPSSSSRSRRPCHFTNAHSRSTSSEVSISARSSAARLGSPALFVSSAASDSGVLGRTDSMSSTPGPGTKASRRSCRAGGVDRRSGHLEQRDEIVEQLDPTVRIGRSFEGTAGELINVPSQHVWLVGEVDPGELGPSSPHRRVPPAAPWSRDPRGAHGQSAVWSLAKALMPHCLFGPTDTRVTCWRSSPQIRPVAT